MFMQWEYVEKTQVLKLLVQLRDFYADENNWIFWPLATDGYGVEVKPTDPKASKWALMGACDLLLDRDYVQPLADCINCATREYLNELSNDDLLHGKCQWKDEFALINKGIEELGNDVKSV